MTAKAPKPESAERVKLRRTLQAQLNRSSVPLHIHEGIIAYVVDGRPVGSFLENVFSNKLREAVAKADAENRQAFISIIEFVIQYTPARCQGSAKAYEEWQGLCDRMTQIELRRDVVRAAVEQTVAGMDEMGMTPQEAMVAAELILWTFMQNAMKLAPDEKLLGQAKLVCTRIVMRTISRVEAWPAKTSERM